MTRTILQAIVASFILTLIGAAIAAEPVRQENDRYVVVPAGAPQEILNPDAEVDRVRNEVRNQPEVPPVIYRIVEDEKALTRKAIVSPPGGANAPHDFMESIAVYRVQFTTAGTYHAYFRGRNNGIEGNPSSDSFFYTATFGEENPSTVFYVQNSGEYKWQKLRQTYLLLPGDIRQPVEFRIGVREPDTHIDAFVFSRDDGLDKTPEKLDALVKP